MSGIFNFRNRFTNVFVCFVLLFSSLCFAGGEVGEDAPEITIRGWVTSDAPDVKHLKGRVYLVEFWATWCSPCIRSIPHLNKLYSKYKDQGLELISLCQDKEPEKIRKIIADKKIGYHVAIDNGSADWFGIKGYPTLILADSKGKIVWRGFPWSRGLDKAIEKALACAPPAMLAGVELGPFSELKKQLCGGKGFAAAFKRIESNVINVKDSKKAAVARKIVDAVNSGISRRIRLAGRLHKKDPRQAYRMYRDIVSRYGGIAAVEPAKRGCLELKQFAKK